MTFSVKCGKFLPINCQMHCLKFPDGSVFSCSYYNFMVYAVLSFLRNILFQVVIYFLIPKLHKQANEWFIISIPLW